MKYIINILLVTLLVTFNNVTMATDKDDSLGKAAINFILRSVEVNRVEFTIGLINNYESTYFKYRDGIVIDGQVCTLSTDNSKIFDICKSIETFTDNIVAFALSLSKEQLGILSEQDNVIAKIITLYFSSIEYFDKNSEDSKICSKNYNAYCFERARAYMDRSK